MGFTFKQNDKLEFTKDIHALEIGATWKGTLGGHTGVFLKHFNGVVCLDKPSKTWTGVSSLTITGHFVQLHVLVEEL